MRSSKNEIVNINSREGGFMCCTRNSLINTCRITFAAMQIEIQRDTQFWLCAIMTASVSRCWAMLWPSHVFLPPFVPLLPRPDLYMSFTLRPFPFTRFLSNRLATVFRWVEESGEGRGTRFEPWRTCRIFACCRLGCGEERIGARLPAVRGLRLDRPVAWCRKSWRL